MKLGDVKDITDLFNKTYGYDLCEYGWKIVHEAKFNQSNVLVLHDEKVVAFQKGIFLDSHLMKVMLRNAARDLIDANTGYIIDAFHGLFETSEVRFGVAGNYAAFKCPGITVYTELGVGRMSDNPRLDPLTLLSLQSQIGEQFVPPLSIKRVVKSNLPKPVININLRESVLEIQEDRRNWDEIYWIDFHATTPDLISFTKHHIILELVDENYYVRKQHRKYTLLIHNGLMTVDKEDVHCHWSEQILGYGDLVINPYTRDIADYIENDVVYDGQYIFKNHHNTYVKIGEEWIMVDDNWFHSPRIPRHIKDEYEMCKNLGTVGV